MNVRLADVVANPTLKGDGTPLPYVALEHVQSKAGRMRAGYAPEPRDSSDAVLVRPGDVVFGKLRPYLAKTVLVEGPWCVSPELLVLRPTAAVSGRYLRYLTMSKRFVSWAEATSYGVKMPRTSWDALRLFRFELPGHAEQGKLVAHLDQECARIDELVDEALHHVALVRERESAAVAHLLMRGTRGQPPQTTTLPWLRTMPANWELVRLKYKARLESGHTPTRSREDLWLDCTIPWISLNDVGAMTRNEFLTETVNKISEAGIAASSARVLPAGTVALSRDATIGRSSIMGVPMATSQHFAAWVCGEDVEPRFLWLLFTTVMQQYFDSLTDGATLRTIGMGDLREFRVPLPPVAEQRELVEEAESVRAGSDEAVAELLKQVELLNERRQALIGRALSGGALHNGEAA